MYYVFEKCTIFSILFISATKISLMLMTPLLTPYRIEIKAKIEIAYIPSKNTTLPNSAGVIKTTIV